MPIPESIEDQKDRALFDSQPAVARCALCPDQPVIHEGTAKECRDAYLEHRRQQHPEIKDPKRSSFGTKRACNVGDCMNPQAARNGRYAGMCARHRDDAKRQDETNARQIRGGRAGGAVRKRRTAERRERRTLMTPPRVDAAWRIYQAGCTIRQIAHLAYQLWGYTNETACSHAIGVAFKQAGHPVRGDRGPSREIPDISRSEALALVEETR